VRVLITGVAGFIGFHLGKRLLARGDEVLGLDNLNDYYDVTLKKARLAQLKGQPGFRFYKLDLADRDGISYIIGVKTRCKFKDDGRLNDDYNMVKKGADVAAVAERYKAQPAWVTIQVVPELQILSAFFGKLTTERLSVSMRERDTEKYKRDGKYICLADQEADATILADSS